MTKATKATTTCQVKKREEQVHTFSVHICIQRSISLYLLETKKHDLSAKIISVVVFCHVRGLCAGQGDNCDVLVSLSPVAAAWRKIAQKLT